MVHLQEQREVVHARPERGLWTEGPLPIGLGQGERGVLGAAAAATGTYS